MENNDIKNLTNASLSGREGCQNAIQSHFYVVEKSVQKSKNIIARKEDEEKLRHQELIKAISNNTSVTIGDGANNVQIVQNSNNSSQSIVNSKDFDYDKVLNVLTDIKGYSESIKFKETFKESTDDVSSLIDETIKEVEEKGDEKLIQKSLKVLKDISISASSNLISSGIIALIGGLNI